MKKSKKNKIENELENPLWDIGNNSGPADQSVDISEPDMAVLGCLEQNLRVEVGRTHMKLKDIRMMSNGSVNQLHRLTGEELDIFIGEELWATGNTVTVNQKRCVRITRILTDEEKHKRLKIAHKSDQYNRICNTPG